MSEPTYSALEERFARLDRRHAGYRFEAAEAESCLPGAGATFFPEAYLASLGVELEVLRADPAAIARVQWAMALAHCRLFIRLERFVRAFIEQHRDALHAVRSVAWLDDEEDKHVAMFERFAEALSAQDPAAARRLSELEEAHFGAQFELVVPEGTPVAAAHHLHWLMTVLFEELTVHLHRELVAAGERIDPGWARLHRLHAQEELQHVPTTAQLAEATSLSAEARRRWSAVFVAAWGFNVGRLFTFPHVRELFATEPVPLSIGLVKPFPTTGLCQGVRFGPSFRRTQQLNPALWA